MSAFLAAQILTLIKMLLGYFGSKTEAGAVACATQAHHLFSAEWKLSRRQQRANIEADETSPKHTGYVLACQLIDVWSRKRDR